MGQIGYLCDGCGPVKAENNAPVTLCQACHEKLRKRCLECPVILHLADVLGVKVNTVVIPERDEWKRKYHQLLTESDSYRRRYKMLTGDQELKEKIALAGRVIRRIIEIVEEGGALNLQDLRLRAAEFDG